MVFVGTRSSKSRGWRATHTIGRLMSGRCTALSPARSGRALLCLQGNAAREHGYFYATAVEEPRGGSGDQGLVGAHRISLEPVSWRQNNNKGRINYSPEHECSLCHKKYCRNMLVDSLQRQAGKAECAQKVVDAEPQGGG